MKIEPFGYFKADPCGWTDCAETDEGAQPLYDKEAVLSIQNERDYFLAALENARDSMDRCEFAGAYRKIITAILKAKSTAE